MGCESSHLSRQPPVINVYFGSQTGTGEGFANQLKDHAVEKGFQSEVIDLEDFDEDQLKSTEFAVFFLSCYGNGEPTDNAQVFYDWLLENKKETSLLPNLTYCVFGLGDHYYPKYNVIGKAADLILGKMGATPFMPVSLGDAAEDINHDFEEFEKTFWNKFISTYSDEDPVVEKKRNNTVNINLKYSLRPASAPITETYIKKVDLATVDSKYQHFYTHVNVPVVNNTELCLKTSENPNEDVKSIHQIDMSLPDSMTYQTAGTVSVLPENDSASVEELAKLQNYDLESIFHLEPKAESTPSHLFPTPSRVRICLTRYMDLHGLCPSSLLAIFSSFAESEQEQAELLHLSSSEGSEDYKQKIVAARMSVLDVLKHYPSVHIPLETFVQVCPVMTPREYSISSDPSVDAHTLTLTIGRLSRFDSKTNTSFKGLCSNYLCDKPVGQKVRIDIHPSKFVYPTEAAAPMILVAVGSGIAPLRSILRHRSHLPTESQNPVHIYYGCRSVKEDNIYYDEFSSYIHEKDQYVIAFSRDQDHKVYVNDKLMENGESVYQVLTTPQAIMYICGSKSMGANIMNAIKSIFQQYGHMNEEEANNKFNSLSENHQLFLELW